LGTWHPALLSSSRRCGTAPFGGARSARSATCLSPILLALTWADIDFQAGVVGVRAQLSRAHVGAPARRIAPKTRAAVRNIPLAPQLATVLARERARARFAGDNDYVFATRLGTPLGQRNVARTALAHAVTRAGLDGRGRPPLRFHDLRHTFASHLIVDLRLDVCQVSRILGHARTAITLDVYTHLFEQARHAADVRAAMAGSRFAQILAEATAPEPRLATEATLVRPIERHPLSTTATPDHPSPPPLPTK
jgi:integrase